MSIFKKREATKAPKTKTTAPAAPEEKPAANATSESVIINVVGFGPENWVHFNTAAQFPMPDSKTFTFENLPINNCAVPAGWWFPEFSDAKELVYEFPNDNRELLCLAYHEPAMGVQYVTFRYEPSNGTVFASIWGYDRTKGDTIWQTVTRFDVLQTFRPYMAVINGKPAMSYLLCDTKFVLNVLLGSPLHVRAAYQQTYETAEETYDMLMEHVAMFIAHAAKGTFKHDLKLKSDKVYNTVIPYVKKLESIITEAENLTANIAVKKFYGTNGSEADWKAAQDLHSKYITIAKELIMTEQTYDQLVNWCNACGLGISLLSNLEVVINLLRKANQKVIGVFNLLKI